MVFELRVREASIIPGSFVIRDVFVQFFHELFSMVHCGVVDCLVELVGRDVERLIESFPHDRGVSETVDHFRDECWPFLENGFVDLDLMERVYDGCLYICSH